MKNTNPEPNSNTSQQQEDVSSKTRRFTKKKEKQLNQNQQKEIVLSVQSNAGVTQPVVGDPKKDGSQPTPKVKPQKGNK